MVIKQVSNHGRARWRLDARFGGKRVRTFYATRAKAEAALAQLRLDLQRTGDRWTAMSAAEREDVMAVWLQAKQAGLTLRQVWDGFRAHRREVATIPLREAVDKLVAHKQATGRRDRYVAGLRAYLLAFARGREQMPVSQIGPDEVRQWFAGRNEAPATMKSNLGRLSALFALALRERWTVDNPCDGFRDIRLDAVTPRILTVEQARTALVWTQANAPDMLAGLTLMLLAGLRPEEVAAVTWEDIALDSGTVLVRGEATKTRRRRSVHLAESAVAWLRLGGRLPVSITTRKRFTRRLRAALGFEEWPQDVLRHTAASFLLAAQQDAARVALELGHSERVLFRHYRDLVSPAQAAEFWGIRPEGA